MLFLLGIDSQFGMIEAAVTPIFDAKILPKWMKKWMFTGTKGRLQKRSLAIVYRNQWLNWFP